MPAISTERLELVSMSVEFVDALLAGRRHDAEAAAGIVLPDGWPDDHDGRFLRFRLDQMRRDPSTQQWLVRAIALREPTPAMIGHAGFHGPPGVNAKKRPDAVELGYTVFEPHRRRGYATETVRGLMCWARDEHGIRHFVASVAPDNEPSLAIVRKLGFEETGSHWDEEDGDELEFELEVP